MAFEDWRIVLISSNRSLLSELTTLAGAELPGAELEEQYQPSGEVRLDSFRNAAKRQLCILDLISNERQGLAAVHAIRTANPAAIIVSVVNGDHASMILQALRQGANDFLTYPFTDDQFHAVLEKLAQQEPDFAAQRGKVVAVVPAKGACGASTIAFNLAVQMRKAGVARVLLADLDGITGTQSFQMKLKPYYSFLDALQHEGQLDADLWKGMVQSFQGVDVLLPPENPIELMNHPSNARPVLEFSRKMYQWAVADVGHGYDEWALSVLRIADEVLLVSTNELPALQAAQRLLSFWMAKGLARHKIRLVLNRHNKDVGLTKETVEMALSTDVYQTLPSDYECVQRALMEGKPVPVGSVLGKQLAQLAERMAGHETGEVAAKSTEKKKAGGLTGLLSLFSRAG